MLVLSLPYVHYIYSERMEKEVVAVSLLFLGEIHYDSGVVHVNQKTENLLQHP